MLYRAAKLQNAVFLCASYCGIPGISFDFSLTNVNAEDLREGISVPSPFVCFRVMSELVNLVFCFRFIMPQI